MSNIHGLNSNRDPEQRNLLGGNANNANNNQGYRSFLPNDFANVVSGIGPIRLIVLYRNPEMSHF